MGWTAAAVAGSAYLSKKSSDKAADQAADASTSAADQRHKLL